HEVVDLTDETELRLYELINDFRYLRKDVRDLASPTTPRLQTLQWVEQLTGNGSVEQQRQAQQKLSEAFASLLNKDENYYYLELSCLQIHPERDGQKRSTPLVAVGRPSAL